VPFVELLLFPTSQQVSFGSSNQLLLKIWS
jgi:hypothetical protein